MAKVAWSNVTSSDDHRRRVEVDREAAVSGEKTKEETSTSCLAGGNERQPSNATPADAVVILSLTA